MLLFFYLCHKIACIGSPADHHFVSPSQDLNGFHRGQPQQNYPRKKGPGQRERDRARAAAHRASLGQQHLPPADQPVSLGHSSAVSADFPLLQEPSQSIAAPAENLPDPPPIQEITSTSVNPTDAIEVIEDRIDKDIEVEEICATVQATAHLVNSPHIGITEDDVRSIYKFIVSEKHLAENIRNIEIDILLTSEASVKMFVKKAKVSEGATENIEKHLGGTNFWDRQNGTRIRLKRIHEK